MSDILVFGTGMTVELGSFDAGWTGALPAEVAPVNWSAEPEPGGMQLELGFFSVNNNTGVPAERIGWRQQQRPARSRWIQASGKPVDWED